VWLFLLTLPPFRTGGPGRLIPGLRRKAKLLIYRYMVPGHPDFRYLTIGKTVDLDGGYGVTLPNCLHPHQLSLHDPAAVSQSVESSHNPFTNPTIVIRMPIKNKTLPRPTNGLK